MSAEVGASRQKPASKKQLAGHSGTVRGISAVVVSGDRSDAVYEGLRSAIIEQSLLPGTKLPEDAIGESFGVSRTLVRAALGRLSGEGLVEHVKNRGSVVASPSLAEAHQIFDLRRQLEGFAVESLAGRLTETQMKRLRVHVAAERSVHAHDGPKAIRLAGEFHVRLAEFTGNALLARYVSEVVSRSSLILALYSRPHSSECGSNEHQDIIDALHRGDASTARRLMDHHLGAVQERALLPKDEAAERTLKDVLAPYVMRAG